MVIHMSKKYDRSNTRVVDEFIDRIGADVKVQELIDYNRTTAKESREYAERWAKTNNDLMNMSVTALTSKKDIRKVYWS